MFIAHLPAGYICANIGKSKVAEEYKTFVFKMLLLGSILPDIDMLYFYLVDGRQTHHHLYWTHLPIFWLALYLMIAVPFLLTRQKHFVIVLSSLIAGVFLHLVLDTPVGGIAWLYPFSGDLLYFVEVPATQSWWVWNFVLHWTFLIEITICVIAITIYPPKRRPKDHATTQQPDHN